MIFATGKLLILAMISIPFQPTMAGGGCGHRYAPGVSLRYPNSSCPVRTYYTGTSFQSNCCPVGEYSSPSGTEYCCFTESNCKKKVIRTQRCADNRWNYCSGPNNTDYGICCLPNWVCYQQLPSPGNGGGFACGPPGYQLQSGQVPVPTVRPGCGHQN